MLTSLALDLFAGPASSLLGAWRELLVGTSVASHGSKPIGAEVVAILAVREGLGNIARVTLAKQHADKNMAERTQQHPCLTAGELRYGSGLGRRFAEAGICSRCMAVVVVLQKY